ncbi:tetraspanin-15-like isoform X2 [Falco cherrug]|uniref:tetraspanin-15-like isoform X2 n=1 Tax=Falco cherrug TaxID=345164 RepID=UPI002479641A|nr:tetraspanin-15-like isoform X2 [Falco cherrug]
MYEPHKYPARRQCCPPARIKLQSFELQRLGVSVPSQGDNKAAARAPGGSRRCRRGGVARSRKRQQAEVGAISSSSRLVCVHVYALSARQRTPGAGRSREDLAGSSEQTPLTGVARMAQASECRNSHFYYYSIKFALSTYATLFSILGLVILCVGIYAEVERQKHKTLEGIFLAPAIILLLLGFTMFGVSFVGMVGSLRDNRTLLKTFFWVLLVIFLTELLLLFIEIIFENKMNAVFHSNIQEGIRHYYDDLDFKNILDFVQEKFSCCGGDEYRDWEVNQYHSCNGSGPLACGVPYTCCIRKVPGEVINTLCGYRTLDKERLELLNIIHVRGCIHAVGLWLKDNFEATLGIVCSLLLPQVIGLVMAWLYWQKLDEIYSKLDTVDFRILEMRDFSFGAVDLSGAGWCWCLPKEGGYIPVNAEDEEDEGEEGTVCHSKV